MNKPKTFTTEEYNELTKLHNKFEDGMALTPREAQRMRELDKKQVANLMWKHRDIFGYSD